MFHKVTILKDPQEIQNTDSTHFNLPFQVSELLKVGHLSRWVTKFSYELIIMMSL
jgi:hypothetical protein